MPRVQCSGCSKWSSKVERTLTSTEDLQRFQPAFPDRQLCIGNKLCARYRLFADRIVKKEANLNIAHPCSSSSEIPSTSSDSETAGYPTDDDFAPPSASGVPEQRLLIEMPLNRVVSTEAYCFICRSESGRKRVPPELRMQVFVKRRLFVPKNNRCCEAHLIRNRLFEDDVMQLRLAATTSLVDKDDLMSCIEVLAREAGATIRDRVGSFSLTDEQIQLFTGLTYDNLDFIASMLPSMRNVEGRSVFQALVIFFFKMRSGNSNATVAGVFGLTRPQQVSEISESVIQAFEKDVLPFRFGLSACSRDDLIQNQTSLCKPFTICTTTGYVVDILGPYTANLNDAKIMEIALRDSGLGEFLRAGDVCLLDRGFRDVVAHLEQRGLTVFMPSLKGNRKQLTTEEANHSRFVTKLRWAVEAVHGVIKQKYRILDHRIDNDLLPKIGAMIRIACFLNNTFGKRLASDQTMFDEVVGRMQQMRGVPNTLAQEVEEKGWNRVQRPWCAATSDSVPDFPELTDRDLKILFTGTYQLSQSVSYLAEMLNENGSINLKIHRDNSHILKVEVRSRHISRKTYKLYIEYIPESIGHAGIKRHYCECANGTRTVGCCSHVAAVVYYLSHARYLSKIVRPAEILSSLFHDGASVPVINEDSDED